MNVLAYTGVLFLATWLCPVSAGDSRATDETGQPDLDTSTLILHVRRGNADKVAELLQSGASPKAANSSGMTALQYAAMRGHIDIIKMLISKGAEVNTRDTSGGTPIYAAAGNSAEAVKLLLEAGATPHPEALGFACWLNRGEAAALLLNAGVSPDAGMVRAARGGHVKLLGLLLDKGADVNAKSKSGNTALHTAALQGGIEAVKLLLKEGADPNAKNDRGKTPLHLAITGDSDVNSIKLLISAGSKVDVPDKQGVAPVRLAAIRGQSEVYKLLLAANGGVERRRANGQTPTTNKHARPTAKLIEDLTSNDREIRRAAQVALLARGKGIMPEVMQSIESGVDMGRFYELFQKMGPDAEAALPKLKSLLGDKKHVFAAVMTMECMTPGSLVKLPKRSRETAAAALYAAATDPDVAEMMPYCYLGYMYRLGDVATPHILKLLRSDKPQHRALAAGTIDLASFDNKAAEAELVKMVLDDNDLQVRITAARALGTMRVLSDEASAALLTALLNPKPSGLSVKDKHESYKLFLLSQAACGSLGKADPKVLDDLIPLLSHKDTQERIAAIRALRSIGAPAVPRLIELLSHSDAYVSMSASVALNRIGRPAVPALAKELTSKDEQVIVQATSALLWIGHGAKQAVPALLKVAGSEERSDVERLAAARAALKIDGKDVHRSKAIVSTISVAIRTLEKGRFKHQGWAAETLRGIGPAAREALPMLRKRLVLPEKGVDTDGLVSDYVQRESQRAISAIAAGLPDKPTANP